MAPAHQPHKPYQEPGRRALTAVGNVSPHMAGEMCPGDSKESREMEAMLAELDGAELAPHDLLQAIKTLEGGADALAAAEADGIFPLSSFDRDLLEPDSESDAPDDKIRATQARLERRCSFLRRRLRVHQARALGKRVSEEVARTYERCGRATRKDGSTRPTGLKSLLKRVETTAGLQASAAARPHKGPSYYRLGKDSSSAGARAASLSIGRGVLPDLADRAGALRSDLNVVRHQLDPDATASSSGAESNDEAITYTNLQQEPLAIERRALWHWQRTRASLAARWTWLLVQVQELEYKIRQQTELRRQLRASKGPLQFEGEPGGYAGPLPGSKENPSTSHEVADCESCARVRPLKRDTFRKRKLLQMHNIHTAAPRAAQPADIRCGCQPPLWGCGVCTGRAVATQPLPHTSTLAPRQRLALLEPGYHSVLSDIHDVSPSIHMAAIASRSWWTGRPRTRSSRPTVTDPNVHPHTPCSSTSYLAHAKKRKQPPRDKRSQSHRSSTTRKSRDVEDIPPHERGRVRGGGSGWAGEPREARTRLNSAYDIDNIVIPHSVAASTRLEILHYKEIPTPKWRVMEGDAPLNNGLVKPNRISVDNDSEEEDISEASVLARHAKAEQTERCKYVRQPRPIRNHHQNSTESQLLSGEEESNPAAEHQGESSEPPPRQRLNTDTTVRPFSPREFPLADDTYWQMLQAMPQGHPISNPDAPEEPPDSPPGEPDELEEPDETEEPDEVEEPEQEEEDEDYEPPSPLSPLFYEEEDPDDPEWDHTKERDNR